LDETWSFIHGPFEKGLEAIEALNRYVNEFLEPGRIETWVLVLIVNKLGFAIECPLCNHSYFIRPVSKEGIAAADEIEFPCCTVREHETVLKTKSDLLAFSFSNENHSELVRGATLPNFIYD
jgi:hypothetical protein